MRHGKLFRKWFDGVGWMLYAGCWSKQKANIGHSTTLEEGLNE